jgi:hypothetical protein
VHQPRLSRGPSRLLGGPALALVALVAVACGTATSSAPTSTAIAIPSLSLIPATETSTPEPAATLGEVPQIGPPSGPPSSVPPPPEGIAGYSDTADDLSTFVAAYRTAFQVPELSDQQIAEAGARLCSYLKGQADAAGIVDAGRALTDAEINEPGYPREVWQAAFELASTSYCSEFTFDVEGQG